MATFSSSTFGMISGRHGAAVAMDSKLTGKNYLRIFRAPSNPRTDKQVAQRGKFSFVQSGMRPFQDVFKITFGGLAGVNHGIGVAMKQAVLGEYPDFTFDYAQLVFSDGRLDKSGLLSTEKLGTNGIKVDWDNTEFSSSSADDAVQVILFNENANQVLLRQAAAKRETGTTTIEIPVIWTGGQIHCWLYFSSADGKVNSVSQYVGVVQL